jgi:hypothetical protein
MNIPNINIKLTNQNKYNAVSLYPLVQEIFEKYTFEVQSKQTFHKLKSEINSAIKQFYPQITNCDGVTFQITDENFNLYFTKEFIVEMETLYPEALI